MHTSPLRTTLSLLLGFMALLAAAMGVLGIDATRQYGDKMHQIAAISARPVVGGEDAKRNDRLVAYREINAIQAEADVFYADRLKLMVGITVAGVLAALAGIAFAGAFLSSQTTAFAKRLNALSDRQPQAGAVPIRTAQLLAFRPRGFRPHAG